MSQDVNSNRPVGVMAGVLYDARQRWLSFLLLGVVAALGAVYFSGVAAWFYVGVAVFFALTPTVSLIEEQLSEVAP